MRDLAEKTQRKIGMKKGENNLKKLMILAAVAAMAIGAQAVETDYEFILTIENIPQSYKQLTENAKAYLIDTKNTRIVGYAEIKNLDAGEPVAIAGGTRTKLQLAETVTYSLPDKLTVGGVEYSVYAPNMNLQGGDEKGTHPSTVTVKNFDDGTKEVSFELYFQDQTGSGLPTSGDSASGYMIVLSDPGNKDQGAYYQEFTPTFSGGSGVKHFDATAEYANEVPEPTSAMLLLLGFAGLALKRKVA